MFKIRKYHLQIFLFLKYVLSRDHNTGWMMSKWYICKSTFYVCYHFFRYLWKSQEKKNFLNPSCLKHLKIINWNKKWHNFYFHNPLRWLKKISSFWGTKKKCKNKIFVISLLIPLERQGLRLHFVELPNYTISVSLTIEIHKQYLLLKS